MKGMNADQQTAHRQGAPAPARAWWGLVATLGPVLIVAMDGSILFLAMPSISAALEPTTEQSLWILDIYGFAVGSLLITFGNLGDRFGRKRLLLIGAVVFGIGSVCGAFSPTPELLILSRALMGVGGATLLPSCLAVISELFEDSTQRARAIGIFAATFAAGFVIGPILGGVLIGAFWWGSVFLINIPIVIVFLCVTPVLLREVRGSRPGKIDLLSVVASASGLLLVISGMKHASTRGIDGFSAGLFLAGAGILTMFVLRQRRLELPLLDTGLFRRRLFSVAILTGLLSLLVWSAVAYLSMTYMQSVLGLSVLHSALLAIPGAIVLTASSLLAPRLAQRVGVRSALVLCHLFIAAGTLFLLGANDTTGVSFYIVATAVSGVGFGISFSLVAETAVGAVPESRAGAAGAIAETSHEIGNAVGIALLGSVLTLVFRASYPGSETSIAEVIAVRGTASAAYEQAKAAFLAGFHIVAIVAALLCTGLALLAFRWLPRGER